MPEFPSDSKDGCGGLLGWIFFLALGYIGLPLGAIYVIVKFVKWAWEN